ncbi:MAG: beta-lactamase family protein [Colwellia sp.]|nr:beta-lactamase family protein [Colwellia sp.]
MKILKITLLCLIVSTPCLALVEKDKKAEIDRLILTANALTEFNGSVLIGNSKEVLYYERVGYRDLKKTEALTDKHLFNPGSITKEFTTLAIMKLVDDGKLNYQDKLASYLPTLPKWAQKVTVQHVMTHTSGLPRINWIVGIESSDVHQQLMAIKKLAFKPGEGFLYGNLNLVMRVYLVEAITEMSYQDYLKQEIIDIANMHDTVQPVGMEMLNSKMVYREGPNALKGIALYTTPLDLYKFEKTLWQGKFIPIYLIKESLAGDVLSGNSDRAHFDFGRFYPNNEGKLIYWEHDGSANPMHHSLKFHDFEKDLIIIVMSSDGNKQTPFALKTKILDVMETGKTLIPASWGFKKEYKERGFEPSFQNLTKRIVKSLHFELSEDAINRLGYWLIQKQENSQAESIFQLNIKHFPSSVNVYDSYGEVLIEVKNIYKLSKF